MDSGFDKYFKNIQAMLISHNVTWMFVEVISIEEFKIE